MSVSAENSMDLFDFYVKLSELKQLEFHRIKQKSWEQGTHIACLKMKNETLVEELNEIADKHRWARIFAIAGITLVILLHFFNPPNTVMYLAWIAATNWVFGAVFLRIKIRGS